MKGVNEAAWIYQVSFTQIKDAIVGEDCTRKMDQIPTGFHRIRHFGLIANIRRNEKLARVNSWVWLLRMRLPKLQMPMQQAMDPCGQTLNARTAARSCF